MKQRCRLVNKINCFSVHVFPKQRYRNRLTGGALIERRALNQNRGRRIVSFSFNYKFITGPRSPENGLVVPGKFTALTKGAAIGQKLKNR